MSEPVLYFKYMNGSDSHFPKVRFYRSIWLNSFTYASMLCFEILRASKFDIKLLDLCFFENIHLLLISKCLMRYLG